jgi:hypothetical protein
MALPLTLRWYIVRLRPPDRNVRRAALRTLGRRRAKAAIGHILPDEK